MSFLLTLFFLVFFSFSLTFGVMPLFVNKIFSWTEEQIGYYFAFTGTVSFLIQAFGIKILLKKFSEQQMVQAGIILFSIAYFMVGFFNNIYLFILGGFIFSFGFSILAPNIQSLISLNSKENEQGIVLGVAQSFASLARVLGPLIGGLIASYKLNLPYLLSAFLLLIIFIWSRSTLKNGHAIKHA